MIAEVVINSTVKNLDRVFDYAIPVEMEDEIEIGSRVLIPFGRSTNYEEGFVVGLKEKSDYEVKEILRIQEEELSNQEMKLAKWMANRYFCNLSDCIKLMLPPGTATKKIENRAKDKKVQVVYLKKNIEQIKEAIQKKEIKSAKQIKALNFIKKNSGVTIQEIELFTDISRSIIKTLEKNGYVEILEKTIERNPFLHKVLERTEKLHLTEEQQYAYQQVEKAIDEKKHESFLLYGITGSGKTEVYMQLIEKVVRMGRAAILLVPEISLTPQMVDRFIARFGQETIAVLHSKLSIGERYDGWQKIKDGRANIIIGARSAIFAPVKDLGIIIIDEEHDSSYKSETNPRYHAKEIAKKIAQEKEIPLLLGSATPDITTFYEAQEGKITKLVLTKRANESNLPEIRLVDLREELAIGNRSMISRYLYQEIENNLKNKKQTILFLNRRGFSTFIMCRECGYTLKCKNCNISLTYHKKEEILKCHYCNHQEKVPTVCPVCGSSKIKHFGTGTQKLEMEINHLFPNATTIRMDIDTVTKKNSHEDILNRFKNENIDILIGTQMVVKGHHFPNVTLVGVIAADSSLNIDDYRAEERTFDLIVQVAGRAGREKEKGRVLIQTYNPDAYSIRYAQKQNYDLFYNAEIKMRKQLKYPPFCDIIMFGISGEEEEKVKEMSNQIYAAIKKKIESSQIEANLGLPMPAPIDKIKNRFRYRIIIKAILTSDLIQMINECLKENFKTNRTKTRVITDVNPVNML